MVVAVPAQAQAAAVAGSTYMAVTPSRVLDMRDGTGGVPSSSLGGGGTLAFHPAGVPDNATAVVLNVLAIGPSAAGFLTVYPDGSSLPATSNVDFSAGQTTANLVMVGISNGAIDVFNHVGTTDVVADLDGYYVPSTDGTGFTTSPPTRVLDTRDGTGTQGGTIGPVGPGGTISLTVPLPQQALNATAVVLNLTATDGTAPSFLTAYAAGSAKPNTSNLNFDAGQTMANLTVVPVNSRKLTIWNHTGSVDVVADLVGYYMASSGSTFTPITPTPLYNTLDGTGAHGVVAPLGPDQTASVQVAGVGGVPTNASAVLVHLAVTNATQTSFLTAYADGSAQRPDTTNINFAAGQLVSNSMIVPMVNGAIDLWNSKGSVDVVADVSGYFMPVG
jgi:hypothetical protein